MVFTFLVFTTLLIITIYRIAHDPGHARVAAITFWEMVAGNCRLNCRRPKEPEKETPEKDEPTSELPEPTPESNKPATSYTFKKAIGKLQKTTLEIENAKRAAAQAKQNPDGGTNVQESAPEPEQNVCVCRTCTCDLIENLVSNKEPAENMYHGIKEAVVTSPVYLLFQEMYTRLINAYPAALEYMEQEKIDSQENFFFHKPKEDDPNAPNPIYKSTNINPYSAYLHQERPVTTPAVPTPSAPPPKPPPSPPPSVPSIETVPPPKMPGLPGWESPRGIPLTIRDTADTKKEKKEKKSSQKSSHKSTPREPQSEASLEREVNAFIEKGPEEPPPLYTCPNCKSQGLVCVRGCPKENYSKKDKEN